MSQEKQHHPAIDIDQKLALKRKRVLASIFFIFSALTLLGIPSLFRYTEYNLDFYRRTYSAVVCSVLIIVTLLLFWKKEVLNWLFWLVVAGSVGSCTFSVIEGDWLFVLAELILLGYVVFYLKTPLTQKNTRIANYIIFPLSVLVGLLGSFLMIQTHLTIRNDALSSYSNFSLSAIELQQAYVSFISEQDTSLLRGKLLVLERTNNKKLSEIDRIQELSASQKTSEIPEFKDADRSFLALIQAHETQALKLKEFIEFNKSINYEEMTDEQLKINSKYFEEILELEKDVVKAFMEFQKFREKKNN